MTLPFDAVIFDLDGTLVDSESIVLKAAEVAFAVHGMEVDHDLLHAMIGVDSITCDQMMVDKLGAMTAEAFNAVWRRESKKLYEKEIPLKLGAVETLTNLRDLGLPVALATSSTRKSADNKLIRTGIGEFFAVTITLDEVIHAKPAPEPYLKAAEALGVAPARCLAFEDSEAGSRAAMEAGMKVVQVPDIVPATGDYAHIVAKTLAEGLITAGLGIPA